MKIDTLTLHNFRKFEDAVFHFHPNFSVLIGDNATGKTSILDALATLLGSYLLRSSIPVGRYGIRKEEARLVAMEKGNQVFLEPQSDVFIEAEGRLHGLKIKWARHLYDRGKNAKELIEAGATDRKQVSKGKDTDLPLLLYYGAGRLWNIHSNVDVGKPESRLVGYRNCLDPKSDQKLFEKWFKQLELAALQQKKTKPALEAVRRAVTTCVNDAGRFYYDVDNGQLMIVLRENDFFPFNNLSDGYRNMVAMVSDIAHRASRLNPHLGIDAATQTPGVVLIDEIDLHLHPKWQRSVVDDLRKAFPGLQFIATTHSPFIIQSMNAGEVIDLNQPVISGASTYTPAGAASPEPARPFSNRSIEDIVEDVMGIPVPQRSKRYQQMYDAAREYYDVLRKAGSADENRKAELKRKLDELSAPFSDNVAYHAFLEMERLASDSTCSERKETN